MGYQNLMNTEKGIEEELKEDIDNEVLRAYLLFFFFFIGSHQLQDLYKNEC